MEKHCRNCQWNVEDRSVGMFYCCECETWKDNVTDDEIDQHMDSYGVNCPEFNEIIPLW